MPNGRFFKTTSAGWQPEAMSTRSSVIVEKCAAWSIRCTSRQGLQFDTANMEAALFTQRRGHRRHLRPKLTAKIHVGNGIICFATQATRWLPVWIAAQLSFDDDYN